VGVIAVAGVVAVAGIIAVGRGGAGGSGALVSGGEHGSRGIGRSGFTDLHGDQGGRESSGLAGRVVPGVRRRGRGVR
jgi:hypothetical protein